MSLVQFYHCIWQTCTSIVDHCSCLRIVLHSDPVCRFSPTTGRRFKCLQSRGSLKANVSIRTVAKTQPTNHNFSAFTTSFLSKSCWGTWWTGYTRSPKVNAKMRLFRQKTTKNDLREAAGGAVSCCLPWVQTRRAAEKNQVASNKLE